MKKLLSFCLALAFCSLFIGGIARADVNDFVINDFHADYEISNNEVGGSLVTKEYINLTFTDQNHGIFRSIPKKNNGYNTKIKILDVKRDGKNEKYSTYSQNGNLVLKIGNADSTITGSHTYEIGYAQERIINFSDGQEFYWDVNGNDWGQTFEKISATVRTNSGVFSSATPICYTGYQGSIEKNCEFSSPDDNVVEFATTRKQLGGQGLTIGLQISGTSFIKPTTKDKYMDIVPSTVAFFVGLVPAVFVYRFWRKQGKDYKGRGYIIPEYQAPKGLTPAEFGMLADYNIDGKDLSATLIDLAVRKYVKIHQETKKFLFARTNKFTLELINADYSKLKSHESALLNAVFDSQKVGELKEVSKINKTKMSSSLMGIRKSVKDSLVKEHGLIDEKSDKMQVWYFVGAFAAGFLLFIPLPNVPTGFKVGFGVAVALTFIMGIFMRRRTHAGVEVYEKIKGLELYMKTAEKDRLKMMQSVDRPYAEPSKTADLFEKLLPFAVALGVEKSWAKQFDGVLTSQPDWISSNNVAAFSAGSLASSIGGVSTSFSSSFQTSSGASSGSSGGGGGGGGGGGW